MAIFPDSWVEEPLFPESWVPERDLPASWEPEDLTPEVSAPPAERPELEVPGGLFVREPEYSDIARITQRPAPTPISVESEVARSLTAPTWKERTQAKAGLVMGETRGGAMAYGITRFLSTFERAAFGASEGFWRLARFGRNVAAGAPDEPGWLEGALERMSQPEKYGLITPPVSTAAALNAQRAEQRGTVARVANSISDTTFDLTGYIAQVMMFNALSGVGTAAGVKGALVPAAGKTGAVAHIARTAGYRFATTGGDFEDRAQSALMIAGYNMTPFIVGELGATGLTAFVTDVLLNSFLTSPSYVRAYQQAANSGNANKLGEFIALATPQFIVDVGMAWQTKGLPENVARKRIKSYLNARAKTAPLVRVEAEKFIMEARDVLTQEVPGAAKEAPAPAVYEVGQGRPATPGLPVPAAKGPARLAEVPKPTKVAIKGMEQLQGKIRSTRSKIQQLEGKVTKSAAEWQTLNRLKALQERLGQAAERSGSTPEEYRAELGRQTPRELLRDVREQGRRAPPEDRTPARAITENYREVNQVRKEVEANAPATTRPKPLLDWMAGRETKVLYLPGRSYLGAEVRDFVKAVGPRVRKFFRRVKTMRPIHEGREGQPFDELLDDARRAGVVPDGTTGSDFLRQLREEGVGRQSWRARLEDMVGRDQEEGRAYFEQEQAAAMQEGRPPGAEPAPGAWEQLGMRLERAESRVEGAADQLRDNRFRRMALASQPEMQRAAGDLRDDIADIERLATEVSDAKQAEVGEQLKELRTQLTEMEGALKERVEGVPQMRQRIMALAKAKGLTKKRLAEMKQQFLGVKGLTKTADPEKLRAMLTAMEGEPSLPRVTKEAMAFARRRGMSDKVYEYDPATGKESFEEAIRGGRIRPSKGRSITLNDVRRLWNSLQVRAKRKAASEGEVKQLVTEIGPPRKGPPEVRIPAGELARAGMPARIVGLPKWVHSEFTRMNRLCRYIGGGLKSACMRLVFDRASTATDAERTAELNQARRTRAKLKELGLSRRGLIFGRRRVPGTNLKMTPVGMGQTYLYSMDKDAREAMVRSGQLSEVEIGRVVAALRPAERAFADWVKEGYGSYYPRVRDVAQDVFARQVQQVDNYCTMLYAGRRAESILAESIVDEFADRTVMRARRNVERGMIMSRVGPSGRPLRLDLLGNWIINVNRFEHFIHTAAAVDSIRTITENPAWQGAISAKYGDKMVDTFKDWLEDGFQLGMSRRVGQLQRAFDVMRRNTAVSLIGLNVLSFARAPISYIASIGHQFGAGSISCHLDALGLVATHPIATRDFVLQRAPALRNRFATLMREFQEISQLEGTRFGSYRADIARASVAPYRLSDYATVTAAWMAHYMRGIKLGEGEAVAILRANHAIEFTQPMARPIDLAPAYREKGIVRPFLMFQNQINQIYNIMSEDIPAQFREAEINRPADWVKPAFQAAATAFFATGLTAYTLTLIRRGRLPKKREAGKDMLAYGLGVVPGAGPLAQAFIWGYSLSTPAGLAPIESLGRALRTKAPVARARNAAKALLMVSGVPSTQPDRTLQGLYDFTVDKTRDVRRLIYRASQLKPDYMSTGAYELADEWGLNIWDVPRDPRTGKVGLRQVREHAGLGSR